MQRPASPWNAQKCSILFREFSPASKRFSPFLVLFRIFLTGTGTSGTSSSGGGNSRPGHRKSSLALALTPEDEPMDVYQVSSRPSLYLL